jgi:RES domain-containing protein
VLSFRLPEAAQGTDAINCAPPGWRVLWLTVLSHLAQGDSIESAFVLAEMRLAVSRAFGDAWLAAKTTPAMLVPTIITPGEWNVLVNPLHPQFSLAWIATGPDAYTFAVAAR